MAASVNGHANGLFYPYPTTLELEDKPIDEIRQLKVAVIGAGLSGITAGILLPAKVPGIQVTILEKNADVGGTWFENIYPGVRCDVAAHTYQSTFSPNTQWSEEYAQGPEILKYWQDVARKYDVYSKIRFNTKVMGAYWEPDEAKWRIDTITSDSNEKSSAKFDFLVTCHGLFNAWKLPDYPGIELYKGKLMHSSNWDPSFDPKGKRIATIGNGASGLQVTPEVRKVAAHVDHYARSRTWIAGNFGAGPPRQDKPITFSKEQLEEFKDPESYLKFRKEREEGFWRNYDAQLADTEASQKMRGNFIELMKNRLEHPELLDDLIPDFPPLCRRLTPGPGYLEALSKPNLTFIQTPIERFTEDGIVTMDGVHRPVEAIICSTGANTDFAPAYPIVSGSYDLSRDWKPGEHSAYGFPYTYIGMTTPHFPNLAFALGPNQSGNTGTLVSTVEMVLTYVAKILRKISSQGIKTITPSQKAADEFLEYCDTYFPRMNLSRNCSSWSNGGVAGARIHGHWPGSAAHVRLVRAEPRWEDFEYTYYRPENRFAYFGNGKTKKEYLPEADMTKYLRLPEQDLRDLHERWYEY
ncbi:hypothetical protein BDY17DRAFT_305945 [Neohortaea acidophila]|uniref:FAD/NAD(P)-binding domain-containing protein n=1 Tax=Neohortaea acidophila TaxID=245834 RepID=A0A6A6PGK1_9PEZI|nr:uncharacterized protein BDY17DRAFT_305945 [Neohortaea acidophila]KAF2478854.1 hypothetical protein BDY17DRAFT_305945 [Neohortaea acidophila]